MKAPRDWEADNPFIPLTAELRPVQGTLPPKYQAMNDKAQAEAAALKSLSSMQPPGRAESSEAKPVPKLSSPMQRGIIAVVIAAALGLLWSLLRKQR